MFFILKEVAVSIAGIPLFFETKIANRPDSTPSQPLLHY
jgi:hypothetical protein